MGMDSGRLEHVPPGTVNLDTVRSLHQTVVSLRTALEVSKNELKELKEKYQKHSDCIGYADVIDKLTIENHILRRKVIKDSNFESRTPSPRNIKLQVTYSPKRNEDLSSDVFIHTATTDAKSQVISTRTTSEHCDYEQPIVEDENRSTGEEIEVVDQVISSQSEKSEPIEGHEFCGTDDSLRHLNKEQSLEENSPENLPSSVQEESPNKNTSIDLSPQTCQEYSEKIDVSEFQSDDIHSTYRAKLELLSKFNVKIKVCTLNEDSTLSTTTSDSGSLYGDTEKKFEKRSRNKTFEKGKENFFPKNLHEHFFATEEKSLDKNEKDTETHIQFVGKTEERNKKNKSFPHKPKERGSNTHFKQRQENFESIEELKGDKINIKAVSSENIKMAVSNEGDTKGKVDNFDIQVHITSEENLVVKETTERCRRKDRLTLDVDNLSIRSMSEGDNSVFAEQAASPQATPQATTPQAQAAAPQERDSDESEVDDIELIFTTDESKDMSNLHEDLVSYRDSDSWTPQPPASAQSTPVLVKFHTLDPDFTTGSCQTDQEQENSSKPIADSLKTKRVSLPCDKDISIRHVAFHRGGLDLPGRGILKSCDNKSDNMLYRKSPNTSSKRLNSVDSLSGEYNRGLSFDNTKSSSFELGSSLDMIRDESEDSFHRLTHLGHRFSVHAETDISKCGISEDDLAVYARRNTCPNPFQYRAVPRSSRLGPLKAPPSLRPIIREGGAPRTDSGAQTDVSALPPRWGSDGYLAYQKSYGVVPLPQLRLRPPPRAPRLEPRTQLLSDIGFTSMVPELSRSCDPLCAALARRVAPPGIEPETTTSANTGRLLSRDCSHRSPSLSLDRSSEWTPLTLPLPGITAEPVSWRASLPDVRSRSRSPDALADCRCLLRRSHDSLRTDTVDSMYSSPPPGRPYIPREPKQLRLGHAVKVITPCARVAVGRVRYVGIAGATAADSAVVVGLELPSGGVGGRNDGLHHGRRYFHAAPQYSALFVPFNKVVMAWAN